MFLYTNEEPHFIPGGFALTPFDIYLNKIDANGQEVGPEDFGASPEPYDRFTFEFEADGVAYVMECMSWRDRYDFWSIPFSDYYTGNTYPNELTFGGTPSSALSVLDVPVENAYVGDTPVVAMYVGKSKVFPLEEWRKFNVDVKKVLLSWVDDKYRIDYIITNNSEYPVIIKGSHTPRFEITMEPNQSQTAEFWAIDEGSTHEIKVEAFTDTGYNFFVYEDEVNVPGKAPVEDFRWRLQTDNPEYKPGYANNSYSTIRHHEVDLDEKKFVPDLDAVWEVEVNGVNKWRGRFTQSTKQVYGYYATKGNPTFPSFGTSGEIKLVRLP